MSPYDIYSLFGNAITNAIEAVTKIEDKEKRNISLVMKKKGKYIDHRIRELLFSQYY